MTRIKSYENLPTRSDFYQITETNTYSLSIQYTGWPKKVIHYQMVKKSY